MNTRIVDKKFDETKLPKKEDFYSKLNVSIKTMIKTMSVLRKFGINLKLNIWEIIMICI